MMKSIHKRFEVIFTQDDSFTTFHILLDKETQNHYLWIITQTGMALTSLKTTDSFTELSNLEQLVQKLE